MAADACDPGGWCRSMWRGCGDGVLGGVSTKSAPDSVVGAGVAGVVLVEVV